MLKSNMKLIIVTNRKLAKSNFLKQVEAWAKVGPSALILREKDLSVKDYCDLAKKFLRICRKQNTVGILHSHFELLEYFGREAIHLPLCLLKKFSQQMPQIDKPSVLGVSVHSSAEAIEAYQLGASYLFFGNIFETDCKKGLPGRGIAELKEVVAAVPIPVYGIGGVRPENFQLLIDAQAAGGAIMSSAMICKSPETEFAQYNKIIYQNNH